MVICYIYKKGGNVMSNYKNPQRYKNGDWNVFELI